MCTSICRTHSTMTTAGGSTTILGPDLDNAVLTGARGAFKDATSAARGADYILVTPGPRHHKKTHIT